MAIQLANGEYITVEDSTDTQVIIRRHLDSDQRTRYKNGEMTEFETTIQESKSAEVDLSTPADESKSILDNKITAGYIALKTLDEFSEAIDI